LLAAELASWRRRFGLLGLAKLGAPLSASAWRLAGVESGGGGGGKI